MRRKGFTLMEMLIVIAVIAILVAIAIPGFRGMQDQANKSRAQAELKTLKSALESYALNNAGAYPAIGASWQDSLTAATPKIVEVALTDPFGTGIYKYAKSSNGKRYVVYSVFTSDGSHNASLGISDTGTVTGTGESGAIYSNN